MKYSCGNNVLLGDYITVQIGPEKYHEVQIIAIGMKLKTIDINDDEWEWMITENIINENSVIVQFVGENPLAHDDPNYAPVSNHMTIDSITDNEKLIRRKNEHE
jgi:hypothetical protein